MKTTNFSIINTRNQEILVENLFIADGFVSRFLGLIGSQPLQQKQGLLISPCQQIHTHFMRFTVGVIFLDKQLKVLNIISVMRPWKISKFIKNAYYVLEVTENSVQNIQIGDTLIIHKP